MNRVLTRKAAVIGVAAAVVVVMLFGEFLSIQSARATLTSDARREVLNERILEQLAAANIQRSRMEATLARIEKALAR